MKRKYLLLFLFLLPFTLFCQTGQPPSNTKKAGGKFLDVEAGVSVPMGKDFPGTDRYNKKAGYAGTGFLLRGTFGWIGKNSLGLGVQVAYQNNPVKKNVTIPVPTDSASSLKERNWENIYLMGGPVYLKQFGKVLLDIKAVGGFVIAISPLFNVFNPEKRSVEKMTATGFGIGLSCGAAYSISPRVSVKAGIGYLGGFPTLEKQYSFAEYDSVAQKVFYNVSNISIRKNLSAFTASAGLIVKL